MAGETYVDDRGIENAAVLWRRIFPKWVVVDENAGGALRVSSQAFQDSDDATPLSMLLSSIVIASGREAADVLAGFDGYSLASITAGDARSAAQGIAKTPQRNEPAHISVFGPKTGGNKRKMAKAAIWVIPPAAGER